MSKLEKALTCIAAIALVTLATWYRTSNSSESPIISINPAPRYMLRSGRDITHAFHSSRDSYWLNISTNGTIKLKLEKDEKAPGIYPAQIISSEMDFNGDGTNDVYVVDNKNQKIQFVKKGPVLKKFKYLDF